MQMPEMETIGCLLRWLKGVVEMHYAENTSRVVNYEDLAYLAAQIHNDSTGNYENPAIGPLNCCALSSLPAMCFVGGNGPNKLGELAGKTVNYIADVTAEMLAKSPSQLKHLGLFREAVMDQRVGRVSLFTLNHDCLLETYLRREHLQVIDGFDKENNLGIRVWNPDCFDEFPTDMTCPAVRLFKLHGSIDWRRFRPRAANGENPWSEEYLGIRSNSSLEQVKDKRGRMHEELDRSLFLAGTFNKMMEYLNHIFLELHYRFHRALADASHLVVCGYGFNDKGINNRITDWMCLSNDLVKRKMILIDPKSPEQFQETARGAVAAKVPFWKEFGRLIHLQFPLGDNELTWERVSAELLQK